MVYFLFPISCDLAGFFLCTPTLEENFKKTCMCVMKNRTLIFKYNFNSFALVGSRWCTDSSNERYDKTQLNADSGGKKAIKGN